MTLVEFYIKVLESTSFSIIEDVVYKDEDEVLTILDIPIALPTKKIINKLLNPNYKQLKDYQDKIIQSQNKNISLLN